MSKQSAYAAKTAYEQTLAQYEAFRAQHRDVLEEHDHLAVALSEAHEELKREFKDNYKMLGSNFAGMRLSVPRELRAEVLIEELGEDAVERLPFIKKKLTIDARKFDQAVSDGLIERDLADRAVFDGSPRVSGGPKALPTIYQP
jgi:hypothetical protein